MQGKFDEGPVRGALDVLCARSGQIAAASRQRADAMALSFEEPLKEAARTIKGVQVRALHLSVGRGRERCMNL